jgi:2-iminobutanoate/2-iminopropanoate deaminase
LTGEVGTVESQRTPTKGGQMEREIVEGPGVPAKIGPYSQAVRAGGFVFVSGQPGVDPETGEPAGPLFSEQARQAFANLDAVLRAGGSRPELVVSTTVLVADQASFPELNELYAEFFPTEPPARMTMQVPLPRGLLISVGCTALTAD